MTTRWPSRPAGSTSVSARPCGRPGQRFRPPGARRPHPASPCGCVRTVATPVRAAGGVLVRDGLIALVHRPRYDDWTLPKGKLDKGEHPLVGACREVWEETGVRPYART